MKWWSTGRRGKRRLAVLVGVNLVLVLTCLEIAGLVLYYRETGGWFYARERVPPGARTSNADANRAKLVLHPFLGYIHRPDLPLSRLADEARMERLLYGCETRPAWTTLHANNFGFFSALDYPYQRQDPREYIVGVFGGSVAHWFALQGSTRLQQHLSRTQALAGRNITFLNFAQGGFKQPQQLQALSYFMALGQQFDLVLNLSGFNEVALSDINERRGLDVSMPSSQHLLPLIALLGASDRDSPDRRLYQRTGDLQLAVERVGARRATTRWAGAYLLLTAVQRVAGSRYQHVLRAADQLPVAVEELSLFGLMTHGARHADQVQDTIAFWSRASLTMQDLCRSRGIPYLEIVQPNQYFCKKRFAPLEKAIAISDKSVYRASIEQGYPLVAQQVPVMQAAGLNIASAIPVFDDIEERVFSDDACHFNQIGNEVLADFVAREIDRTLADFAAPGRR